FGGAYAALRLWPGATQQVNPTPSPTPAPVDPPPSTPPVAISPPVTPPSVAPVNPPTPPPDDVKKPPDTTPEEPTAPKPGPRHPTGPVQLDAVSIQRVVTRGSGPIGQCFEAYKTELPADKGQVPVRFTILQTGKVINAQTVGPLAGTHVGTCLEQR